MTATQISIPSNQSPTPIAPPKPAYLSNGTNDAASLHKQSPNESKKPPLPTKPKPLLNQRISHSSSRLNQTDSNSEVPLRSRIKPVPFTKTLSLESSFSIPNTEVAPLSHPALSPTRSTSNAPAPPPQALKPKSSPSSSPVSQRRSAAESTAKQSPIIARKPLVHIKSATQFNTNSIHANEASNSEDSGICTSPEKLPTDFPPKLPAKPMKSVSSNIIGNKAIIVVPKVIPIQQKKWSTNQSVNPLPPLPTEPTEPAKPTEPAEPKQSEENKVTNSESGERDKKLYRTLPSRGTKRKKRSALLNHSDGTISQPSTPPPALKTPLLVKTSNEPISLNTQRALNLSHSFDSLDSLDSQASTDLSSKKSQEIAKKNARLSGTAQEEKKGKMKRAFFKALGVGRKERSLDQDPASNLSTSISSPAITTDSPRFLSTQSVPAKVSLALNEDMKGAADDSFVFENPSDNEADPEPIPLTVISYDPDKPRVQIDSDISGGLSPAKKSKNSKLTNKPSFTNLDAPSSPQNLYPYTDFPYVFENAESDTDSPISDVEAFDDFDQILDDSDNEMTAEEVNQAKMRTIARAASGITFSKCYYVAKEILSTEEAYVKKLHLVNCEFPEALKEAGKKFGKSIVPEETLKKIFLNLPELYNINSIFRDELKERLDNWSRLSDSTQKIGDIMRRHAHFFKSYSLFIANFDSALKLLDELTKKNSNFGNFLFSFQALPKCCSLPITAHMLGIVQRIPRYKLLLQQYIKHLPEDSEDREDSVKALELISEVANNVNENLKMIDNFNKMIEVLNKIDGDTSNMLAPSRQFIKEGELKKVCRKGLQVRAFFLFTDMLLHTSPPGPGSSTYSLHTRIPLAGMKVSDLQQAEDLSETDPLKHGFNVISAIRSFVVVPSSHEEKEEWMGILNKTLSDLQSKIASHAKSNNRTSMFVDTSLLDTSDQALGSLAPVWIPDDSVSMCMMCYKKFTFARRRHHCRVCGKVVCGPCSEFKTEIRYLGNKQARCCLNCYESLTDAKQSESGWSIPVVDELDQSQASLSENADCGTRNKRSRLRKERSLVPAHLIQMSRSEVEYQMRGNLEYSENSSSKFKHTRWVLLQGNVLYLYKKREDAAAIQTVPIPGYQLDTITETVFVLTHVNVQSRFFKADSKELADKWKKELSNVLDGTTKEVCSETLDIEPPLLRSRSATTSQLVEKETFFDEDEGTKRNITVKCGSKSRSTGGETVSCLETRKLSDPSNSTDSDVKEVPESEEREDLTETITEDTAIESTD